MSLGFNKYQYYPHATLEGCGQDAQDMRELIFRGRLGLTYDSTAVLLDKDGTRKNIDETLEMLLCSYSWIKTVLFSSSGHGTKNPSSIEPDGVEGALVCYDTQDLLGQEVCDPDTLYTESHLFSFLARVPINCLFEAFIDACFAGELAEPKTRTTLTGRAYTTRVLPRRRLVKPYLTRVLNERPNTTVIWAASQPDQTSAEAFLGGKSRGAFTYFLCQKLTADIPRKDLLLSVTAALRVEGFSQRPMLLCSDRLMELPVGSF